MIRTRLQGGTPFFPNMLNNGKVEVCLKEDVDESIAELKDKCQMHDFFWEGCGFARRGFKNTIAVSEAFDKLEAENAQLKQKLENVNELVKESKELLKESQRMHHRCTDNASKQIRRLKRALWLARAERAKTEHLSKIMYSTLFRNFIEKWVNVERKCRAKAEEYK